MAIPRRKAPLLAPLLLAGACAATPPAVDPALEGRWQASFASKTEVGTNGVPCTGGTGAFEINDGTLSGEARNAYNQVYSVAGAVVGTNAVRGEFSYRDVTRGAFEGTLVDGRLEGTFVDIELCRGNWSAARVAG